MKHCVTVLAVCLLLSAAGLSAAQEEVRKSMQQILGSLSALLTIGATPEGFANPNSEAAIESSLGLLVESAKDVVEQPGHRDDLAFGLLAGTLASDARTSLEFYRSGNIYESRLLVDKMTNACFSCHSRLPASEGPGLALGILNSEQTQALPLRNQLRLAVITREFSMALELGEKLLTSPKHSALYLDASGAVDDYLRVAVRVRGDLPRAGNTIKKFRKRDDLPRYLTDTVDTWIRALETIDPRPYSEDKLETAQVLILKGQALNTLEDKRRGLVHFMQASALLQQFVAGNPDPEREAEAYYALGLLELDLARNPWPAEAQLYLEAAIRALPGSETAANAYRMLEESMGQGYAGVLGNELPAELQEKLKKLGSLAFGER